MNNKEINKYDYEYSVFTVTIKVNFQFDIVILFLKNLSDKLNLNDVDYLFLFNLVFFIL